jgi:hypothetical protein
MISEDGKLNNEINSRILAAERMFYSIKSKFLRKREVTEEAKMVVIRPFILQFSHMAVSHGR